MNRIYTHIADQKNLNICGAMLGFGYGGGFNLKKSVDILPHTLIVFGSVTIGVMMSIYVRKLNIIPASVLPALIIGLYGISSYKIMKNILCMVKEK